VRTHVALLRGVNVGGHNKVAMADLREIVESLGHVDVATYIQSGNVVFGSSESDTTRLASALEQEITERLGVGASVIVLSREQLVQVIKDNPFPNESNPRCVHAVFRAREMSPVELASVASAAERARSTGSPDEAAVVGHTLFLWTPDGLGRSVLAAALTRSATAGTARNWATVTKLSALLDLAEPG
jgi:uncharacterized protein (DUF1697 family)